MVCNNEECNEYIESLKEKIEDQARIIESMKIMIIEKDQLLLFYKELDDK